MTTRTMPLPARPSAAAAPRRPAATRLVLLLLMVMAAVVAIWPVAVPPGGAVPAGAPDRFSAQRALRDLEVITAQPRVVGTAGLDEARAYLAREFETLGLTPEIGDGRIVRQSAQAGMAVVAETHNIVARLPGTDSTGAILIGGHLDTVHTTTAAGDCGSCAVGVLEAARALASGAPLRNDVIFLIEDGEETTRAGALDFAERHPWAKDVRVAVNQEAMGTAGASLLYVTGPQNGWLMRQALKALPAPVAYSAINDLVWSTGTGGSDLDQFLLAAPVGLGFAFLGNVPAYHTQRDDIASLDLRTFQHQGESVVTLVRYLGNLPLDGTLTAPDLVYFNLAGYAVVRYPSWVGIGLALLAALGLAGLVWAGLRRGRLAWGGLLLGAGLTLPLVLLACAVAAGVWTGIRLLDPRLQVFLIGVSYDREWYTLAFALLAAGVMLGGFALLRRRTALDLGLGVALWWVLLALLTAWRLPGSSPLFTIPALVALLPAAILIFRQGAGRSWGYWASLAAAAVGGLLLVAPWVYFLGIFSGRAELLLDLPMIALLPALFAALLAGLLLPALDALNGARRWPAPAVMLGLAVAILLGVALTARFDESRPKPNMVTYVQEKEQAYWVTLGAKVGSRRAALLDEWTSQFFPGDVQETTFTPWGAYDMEPTYPAYQGPAPHADLPTAELAVLDDSVAADGLRHLRLQLASPGAAPMRVLHVTGETPIVQASIAGEPLDELASAEQPTQSFWVQVYGFSGEPLEMELVLAGAGAVTLMAEERIYALPEPAGMEIRPRPNWMIPSPTFVTDTSLVRRTFVLP